MDSLQAFGLQASSGQSRWRRIFFMRLSARSPSPAVKKNARNTDRGGSEAKAIMRTASPASPATLGLCEGRC